MESKSVEARDGLLKMIVSGFFFGVNRCERFAGSMATEAVFSDFHKRLTV